MKNKEVNDSNAVLRGVLRVFSIISYFAAIILSFQNNCTYRTCIGIAEETERLLFAIVLSVIGTGIILLSNTIKDIRE